ASQLRLEEAAAFRLKKMWPAGSRSRTAAHPRLHVLPTLPRAERVPELALLPLLLLVLCCSHRFPLLPPHPRCDSVSVEEERRKEAGGLPCSTQQWEVTHEPAPLHDDPAVRAAHGRGWGSAGSLGR